METHEIRFSDDLRFRQLRQDVSCLREDYHIKSANLCFVTQERSCAREPPGQTCARRAWTQDYSLCLTTCHIKIFTFRVSSPTSDVVSPKLTFESTHDYFKQRSVMLHAEHRQEDKLCSRLSPCFFCESYLTLDVQYYINGRNQKEFFDTQRK